MSYNATVVFEEVEAVLGASASEAEVLAAVSLQITAALKAEVPAGFAAQVYALAVLLAAELVAMLVSVGLRCWLGRQSCWLFRLRPTPFGTYLCPNFSFAWQPIVVAFLVFLQTNIWLLYDFSRGNYNHAFYFLEVLCWLGYVLAALTAVWGLACARATELATGGFDDGPDMPRTVPSYARPAFLNTLFPGLIIVVIVLTFAWAGLTSHSFLAMLAAFETVEVELTADAVASVGVTDEELAALRGSAIEVVQVGLDALKRFIWFFTSAFITCVAHTLLVWVLFLAIGIPYLVRLHHRLYRPARTPSGSASLPSSSASSADLRLAFLAACTTALVLSLTCLAYAVLVLVSTLAYGGADGFAQEAYKSAISAVWIFAGLGAVASPVALAHSVVMWRTERGASEGRVGRVVGLWSSTEVASGSGSGERRKEGRRSGGRGRFVVTVERAANGAGDLEGDGLELAAQKAGAEAEEGRGEGTLGDGGHGKWGASQG